MAGFLDAYGVADERRERLIKRIVLWGLIGIVLAATAYFTLRTRSQENIVSRFLGDLQRQDYQDAYRLWCPGDAPCKYYSFEAFKDDWGPASKYANPSAIQVEHVDYCDTGVVFTLKSPNTDDQGLWVERATGTVSFAPWPRCPGRHLQLREFFRSAFS